jgi:hypothetical protein
MESYFFCDIDNGGVIFNKLENCNDFVMVWSKFLTILTNSSQLKRKRKALDNKELILKIKGLEKTVKMTVY